MRQLTPLAFLISAFSLIGNAPAFGQVAADQASPRRVDVADQVAEASQRFGIPVSWIYAVMRTESAGRIGVVSPAGAMGLLQLMPATWARQRARFGLGGDPFDPHDNVIAGVAYLRELYDSYGAPGFLAAYNAGPGRYEDWRDRGRPLPAETQAYVAKIAPALQSVSTTTVVTSASPMQPVRLSWTQSGLFTARAYSGDGASGNLAAAAPVLLGTAKHIAPNGLFAPVSRGGSQ